MRYTTAAAVAAMASGALAAAHGHAAHHRHHEREAAAAAEPAPEPTVYTYSDGQCFGTYGCNAKTGAPASATSAPAQVTSVAAFVNHVAANPGSVIQSVASQATSAAGSLASSVSGGKIDVASIVSKVDGLMAAQSDGSCIEDGTKSNVVDLENKSGKNLLFVCWRTKSWVNKWAPIMTLGMSPNDKKTISFDNTPAGEEGGACSVIYEENVIAQLLDGQIANSWIEWTFNQYGVVDISREPNMNGDKLSATSPSGCTTSMDKCVYLCTDGTSRCGKAGSYQNTNCSGQGANPDPLNGGCMIGTGGHIQVTIG